LIIHELSLQGWQQEILFFVETMMHKGTVDGRERILSADGGVFKLLFDANLR
jgi:hypothetical protein